MRKLFVGVAVAALIAGPAFAQQTISNSPNSAASGSNSAANSGSTSNASNGGIFAPIDASSRTTSTSDSAALSGSVSSAQGGSSSSDAHATGGAAQATTGASTSNATNAATNAGNAQSITFNQTQPDSIKTVPQVYAPALTTTLTETCMGSTSGGASWLGGGFSLGSSWRDAACQRRLDAREVGQLLGDREAARAILCGGDDVREAYERIGRPCPGSPGYKPELAQSYLPQPVIPPPPPPPAPPVIVNVPAPAPAPSAAAASMMAPIPNPAPAPVHRRPVHKSAPAACKVGPPQCPGHDD